MMLGGWPLAKHNVRGWPVARHVLGTYWEVVIEAIRGVRKEGYFGRGLSIFCFF